MLARESDGNVREVANSQTPMKFMLMHVVSSSVENHSSHHMAGRINATESTTLVLTQSCLECHAVSLHMDDGLPGLCLRCITIWAATSQLAASQHFSRVLPACTPPWGWVTPCSVTIKTIACVHTASVHSWGASA